MVACGGSGPPAECPPNVHPAFCAGRPDGGGGGGTSDPTASAGLWEGNMSNGRQTFGALLSDGSYWFFYTLMNDFTLIGGVAEGTATTIGGTVASTNGLDFSLEGTGVTSADITGNVRPQTSLSGTIRYPDRSVSFTSGYVTFPTATLAEVSGTYRGTSAIVSAPGTEAVSWTISAGGAISGTNGTGCNFTGSVTPRTDVAGVFNITVTFGGRLCALGISTVRGIAIYDPSPGHFLTAAVNPGRTDSFIASVVKQ